MSFIILVLVLIVLTRQSAERNALADTRGNCKAYKGYRPKIWSLSETWALYARLNDSRSASIKVSDISNEAAVSNVVQPHQFNCTYNQPIHWIFHLDPVILHLTSKIFRIKGNLKNKRAILFLPLVERK